MQKRKFTIDNVTLEAKSFRTARRRVRGFLRGELDLDGVTIPMDQRETPKSKKKRKGGK